MILPVLLKRGQRNLACPQQQWKICDVRRSHVCTSFHANMTDLMLRLACSPLNKGNYNKSLVPTSSNCATLVSNTNVVNSSCTCNATNWGILGYTRIVESNYDIVSNFSNRQSFDIRKYILNKTRDFRPY